MQGYTNRELSWLAFNHRVLMEARNERDPLFERVRFAGIVSSNLEEFFRVRVGKLSLKAATAPDEKDASGWKPEDLIGEIMRRAGEQIQTQQQILRSELFPATEREGVRFTRPALWTEAEEKAADELFEKQLRPALGSVVPMDLPEDALNLPYGGLYLYLCTAEEDKDGWMIVQIPDKIPRTLQLIKNGNNVSLAFLEDILLKHAQELWPTSTGACAFEIVRNACFEVDDRNRARLLRSLRKGLERQKKGKILCLRCHSLDGTKPDAELFGLTPECLLPMETALSLKAVTDALESAGEHTDCNWRPFTVRDSLAGEKRLLRAIRQRDHFLFHPYDSFDTVIRFLQEASEDPRVVSIKQTLYRVSKKSPICEALIRAASNGKQVTVLMEAKARFDEKNNIRIGRMLEEAGCLVIYGVPGLKIHSKIILITRFENGKKTHYCHLGTGNYNEKTARIYTDMGILTADREIGRDAAGYFSLVEGYREIKGMKELVSAPRELRKTLLWLIRREKENAEKGREAAIEAKMNALVDEEIIEALYEASQAGVKIDLTVRGICCLQPGIPGLSENITVRSIVGRFLEHARVFRFCQDGRWTTYLSSADWMPRNLDRRMELMFPVKNAAIVNRIAEILEIQRKDNCQAWRLEGTEWIPVRDGADDAGLQVNAQEMLLPDRGEE